MLLPTHTATTCFDSLDIVLQQGLAESKLASLQAQPAGAPGSAAWRVRNTGSCTWDSSYALVSLAGEAPQFLPRPVKPGDLLDLSVTFSIPPMPGAHTLFWELRNGRGQRVGNPLAVNLLAVAVPVPTLPPGLTLRAYPQVVQPEERTTVSWNVEGAREVYFYQAGQDWWNHPADAAGSVIDFPAHDTTYELRVVRGDDSVEIHRVRVEVAAYAAPRVVYFRPQRDDTATPDGCIALEWSVRERVNLVVISRTVVGAAEGDEALVFSGGRDFASGVLRDCPPGPSVYTLWVRGPGGECDASYTYIP